MRHANWILALLLAAGGAAAQQPPAPPAPPVPEAAWSPATGDPWIDATLADVNAYGRRYPDAFADELARYHAAPRDVVAALLALPGWTPGDVYFSCALAQAIGRSCRYVADERQSHPGEGWGALAQRLGPRLVFYAGDAGWLDAPACAAGWRRCTAPVSRWTGPSCTGTPVSRMSPPSRSTASATGWTRWRGRRPRGGHQWKDGGDVGWCQSLGRIGLGPRSHAGAGASVAPCGRSGRRRWRHRASGPGHRRQGRPQAAPRLALRPARSTSE